MILNDCSALQLTYLRFFGLFVPNFANYNADHTSAFLSLAVTGVADTVKNYQPPKSSQILHPIYCANC